MNNAHIVPDVVDHVNLNDAVSMRIQYGDRIITNGNELDPSEVTVRMRCLLPELHLWVRHATCMCCPCYIT